MRSWHFRLGLIFVPVIIGACWMLLLDVLARLLHDIRKASTKLLFAMIEWAGPEPAAKPEQEKML